MIKKIIFLAIIGAIVYLNFTNPKPEAHRAVILAELQKSGPVSQELQEKIFRNIDFSNFLVFSAMKTIDDSDMITLGYLKQVKLVNQEWVSRIREKYRAYFSD